MTSTTNKKGATAESSAPKTEIKKAEPTQSERFSNMVMSKFAGTAGSVELSGYQKRLIQNYFISTDMALKAAEDKRLKKSENYRDSVPVVWENVNLEQLAMDVVACSKIGYDPALPNHINMIPYKNNKTNKYDIGFLEGYRGKELKARKYGFDVPDNVIVELVYSKDKFKPLKKDATHDKESFEFVVAENPFDRGEIVGGFYYHEYYDEPRKNKLMFYSKAEIEKRKPEYASAEFWGGEKAKYENGKKVGTEHTDGWYAEMMWKTLFRMAYGIISIDSEKIDDNLMRMLENEKQLEAIKDQDPTEALKANRDHQLEQGTGSKTLKTGEVKYEDTGKKAMATDVAYEEVKEGGDNGQEQDEASGTLFEGEHKGPNF